MIITTREGRRQLRTVAEFGSSAVPRPSLFGGQPTWTGRTVRPDDMFGLPAAGSAIRLVAELIGGLEIMVYRGRGPDRRPAIDSWQYQLLNGFANLDQAPFDMKSDIAAGPEGYGNSVAQKILDRRGRVVELVPLPMDYVRIRRDKNTKEKVFDVYQDGKTSTYTAWEMFHVRGFTPKGGLVGASPVQMYRHSLGEALALEEFSGRFFQNDASVPFAITVPGKLDRRQAKEMLDIWQDSHGGLPNKHKPGLLSNGADLKTFGISLVDAQYIEARRFSVEEISRIFHVPQELLGVMPKSKSGETPEQEALRFMVFYFLPRLQRIESSLQTDEQLFPPGRPEYPVFLFDSMLRADSLTQAQTDKSDVQTGIMLVDEIRARRGQPPLPPVPKDPMQEPGKVPQITPVGGHPDLAGATHPGATVLNAPPEEQPAE